MFLHIHSAFSLFFVTLWEHTHEYALSDNPATEKNRKIVIQSFWVIAPKYDIWNMGQSIRDRAIAFMQKIHSSN